MQRDVLELCRTWSGLGLGLGLGFELGPGLGSGPGLGLGRSALYMEGKPMPTTALSTSSQK